MPGRTPGWGAACEPIEESAQIPAESDSFARECGPSATVPFGAVADASEIPRIATLHRDLLCTSKSQIPIRPALPRFCDRGHERPAPFRRGLQVSLDSLSSAS